MQKLISQFVLGGSTQSVFSVSSAAIPSGSALRVRVNGNDVAFTWTAANQITLRSPARERSIIDVYADDAPALTGQAALATLDFPSIAAVGTQDLTVAVPEAELGDVVSLGLPSNVPNGVVYFGFVSAAGTVKVRAINVTAGAVDPVSGSFRISVSKS